MRLFVAIRPPAAAAVPLADALGLPVDSRWHVTLAFLGERPDPSPLVERLSAVSARHGPMTLALQSGGTFAGRVLSAGLAGDLDALRALAEDVRQTLEVGDDRPFQPHLTLARGRRAVVPDALVCFAGDPWQVTEVLLVRSRLGAEAVHEVLARCPLGRSADRA